MFIINHINALNPKTNEIFTKCKPVLSSAACLGTAIIGLATIPGVVEGAGIVVGARLMKRGTTDLKTKKLVEITSVLGVAAALVAERVIAGKGAGRGARIGALTGAIIGDLIEKNGGRAVELTTAAIGAITATIIEQPGIKIAGLAVAATGIGMVAEIGIDWILNRKANQPDPKDFNIGFGITGSVGIVLIASCLSR